MRFEKHNERRRSPIHTSAARGSGQRSSLNLHSFSNQCAGMCIRIGQTTTRSHSPCRLSSGAHAVRRNSECGVADRGSS